VAGTGEGPAAVTVLAAGIEVGTVAAGGAWAVVAKAAGSGWPVGAGAAADAFL
jgi:hypothetical protein